MMDLPHTTSDYHLMWQLHPSMVPTVPIQAKKLRLIVQGKLGVSSSADLQ